MARAPADVAIAEREEVVAAAAAARKAQGEEKAATEAGALVMLLLTCRPTRLLKIWLLLLGQP